MKSPHEFRWAGRSLEARLFGLTPWTCVAWIDNFGDDIIAHTGRGRVNGTRRTLRAMRRVVEREVFEIVGSPVQARIKKTREL